MNYLSVCSGIEAATVAWQPLGWRALWYSEIEKFPNAALAQHYPTTPNLGDMMGFQEWPDARPDVLVGGTPCQSFSIAGLRKGLDDPRGNLMLTYLAVAARYRPHWLVWENVPGVLSSNGGRDFGALLGALGKLGYGFAYRVLDAQHYGVPQRRRRVFVVGHLGNWRRAAAVLFERASLSGHPAPSREAGERASPTIGDCSNGGGANGPGRSVDSAESLQVVAPTMPSRSTAGGGIGTDFDLDGGLIQDVAHALRADGFDASEDGTGRGTPLVPASYVPTISNALTARDMKGPMSECNGPALMCFNSLQDPCSTGVVSGTLGTSTPQAQAISVAIQERSVSESPGPDGAGFRADGVAYTLEARQAPQAAAFAENSRAELRLCGGEGTVSSQLSAGGGKPGQGMPCIAAPWAVRRLTPRECERLQGFPDDYTRIPFRGKPAEKCPDGPRYKALGNSMAVPVMRWLGERIAAVDAICQAVDESR